MRSITATNAIRRTVAAALACGLGGVLIFGNSRAAGSKLRELVPIAAAHSSHAPPRRRLRPTLEPSPAAARPGATIIVAAKGFPHNIDIFLQVCGDGGLAGSAACDQSSSATVSTTQYGTFRTYFRIGRPPIECPCVIQAVSLQLQRVVIVPFRVIGIPVGPLRRVHTPNPFAALSITAVSIAGSGPWTAWFGAGPDRSIELTLVNSGSTLLRLPPLIVHEGAVGTTPLSLGTESFGVLPAHSTRNYLVPLHFGYFSSGSFLIDGFFAGLTTTKTRFTIGTSMFPWGAVLVAIGVGAAAVGGIAWRVATRRRRSDEAPEEPVIGSTTDGDPGGESGELSDSAAASAAASAAGSGVDLAPLAGPLASPPPPDIADHGERRRLARSQVSGKVTIHCGSETLVAELTDLSEIGMGCTIDDPQPIMTNRGALDAPIVLEDGTGGTTSLDTAGRVARMSFAGTSAHIGIESPSPAEVLADSVRQFLQRAGEPGGSAGPDRDRPSA